MSANLIKRPLLSSILTISLLALVGYLTIPHITYNRLAARTLKGVLNQDTQALELIDAEWIDSVDLPCRSSWYQGFIDHKLGRDLPVNNSWAQALICEPMLMPVLHSSLQESEPWALFAAENFAHVAESWFWLSELQPESQIEHLKRGLQIDPYNSVRWNELGWSLRNKGRLDEALEAYWQGCLMGDAGYNGCLNAGQLALESGDNERAIMIWRTSIWEGSRRRADDLERRLEAES